MVYKEFDTILTPNTGVAAVSHVLLRDYKSIKVDYN